MDWKQKICSRKFVLSLAAFLGSVAASVSGIATNNDTVAVIGMVCGILSAAFYAFAEAWVDSKAVDSNAYCDMDDMDDPV